MAFEAEIASMFADFGVSVVSGTSRTLGILDTKPADAVSAEGYGVDKSLRYLTVASSWVAQQSALGDDASLTIDGTVYSVRRVDALDDGALTEITVVPGSA